MSARLRADGAEPGTLLDWLRAHNSQQARRRPHVACRGTPRCRAAAGRLFRRRGRHAAHLAGHGGPAARRQHHHQGLLVPASDRRPGAGRDGHAPRDQRRPRGPRGGHRRPARSRTPGKRPRPRPPIRRLARPRSSSSRRRWPGSGSSSSRASGSTCCGRCRSILAPILIGCHIPGHWAKGMQAAIRLARRPAPTIAASAAGTAPSTQPSAALTAGMLR